MTQTIQLTHPAGKQAVTMDKGKYDAVKRPMLNCLKTNGRSTHREILRAIVEDFDLNGTKFEGSVEWHMEWVKLDLEARNTIKRIAAATPTRFALVQ